MPRTKRNVSKRTSEIQEEKKSTNKEYATFMNYFLKEFDKKCKQALHDYQLYQMSAIEHATIIMKNARLSIPSQIGNMTVGELRNFNESSFRNICSKSIINTTVEAESVRQKARVMKRSLSAGDDDEGYITVASEQNSAEGKHTSRKQVRQVRTTRRTRSVSRSQLAVPHTALSTPSNPIPASFVGTITPKVKPNTPQIILRRPRDGEMAVSMQGSPLFVNPIVVKEANVNIPLEDGSTIAIQPQAGLRLSQLPPMDPNVLRQIRVLRDNLNKMCQIGN